jgi:hypothetical protein
MTQVCNLDINYEMKDHENDSIHDICKEKTKQFYEQRCLTRNTLQMWLLAVLKWQRHDLLRSGAEFNIQPFCIQEFCDV